MKIALMVSLISFTTLLVAAQQTGPNADQMAQGHFVFKYAKNHTVCADKQRERVIPTKL